jgi:hypothetical protein
MTALYVSLDSGQPHLHRRPLDPRTGSRRFGSSATFSLPDTAGGHLRIVWAHAYRVVPSGPSRASQFSRAADRCELPALRLVAVAGAGPWVVEGQREVLGVGAAAAPGAARGLFVPKELLCIGGHLAESNGESLT